MSDPEVRALERKVAAGDFEYEDWAKLSDDRARSGLCRSCGAEATLAHPLSLCGKCGLASMLAMSHFIAGMAGGLSRRLAASRDERTRRMEDLASALRAVADSRGGR